MFEIMSDKNLLSYNFRVRVLHSYNQSSDLAVSTVVQQYMKNLHLI